MIRANLHLVLHVLVPALVAALFFRDRFWRAFAVMVATMLVDLDHLFANPVYDPGRCSLGFHPLHRYPAIAAYAVGMAWPRLRVVAAGLMVHMALDGVDCVWMHFEG